MGGGNICPAELASMQGTANKGAVVVVVRSSLGARSAVVLGGWHLWKQGVCHFRHTAIGTANLGGLYLRASCRWWLGLCFVLQSRPLQLFRCIGDCSRDSLWVSGGITHHGNFTMTVTLCLPKGGLRFHDYCATPCLQDHKCCNMTMLP